MRLCLFYYHLVINVSLSLQEVDSSSNNLSIYHIYQPSEMYSMEMVRISVISNYKDRVLQAVMYTSKKLG